MNQLLRMERGQLQVTRKYFRISKFLYQNCMFWFSWLFLGHNLLELVKIRTCQNDPQSSRHKWKSCLTKRIDYFTIHCKQLATKPSLSRESHKAWHSNVEKSSSQTEYLIQLYHGKATPTYLMHFCRAFFNSVEYILTWNSWSNWSEYGKFSSCGFQRRPLRDYTVGFYVAL